GPGQARGDGADGDGAAKLAYQQVAALGVEEIAHRAEGSGIAPADGPAVEVQVAGLDPEGVDFVAAIVLSAQVAHQGAVLAGGGGHHGVEQRVVAVVTLEQVDDGGALARRRRRQRGRAGGLDTAGWWV